GSPVRCCGSGPISKGTTLCALAAAAQKAKVTPAIAAILNPRSGIFISRFMFSRTRRRFVPQNERGILLRTPLKCRPAPSRVLQHPSFQLCGFFFPPTTRRFACREFALDRHRFFPPPNLC